MSGRMPQGNIFDGHIITLPGIADAGGYTLGLLMISIMMCGNFTPTQKLFQQHHLVLGEGDAGGATGNLLLSIPAGRRLALSCWAGDHIVNPGVNVARVDYGMHAFMYRASFVRPHSCMRVTMVLFSPWRPSRSSLHAKMWCEVVQGY